MPSEITHAQKKAIRKDVETIVTEGTPSDRLFLIRCVEDVEGRMFVCHHCGAILPIRDLKRYEYYGEYGLSHCCRNLTAIHGPPGWTRTSWKKLATKAKHLRVIADKVRGVADE